MTISCVAFIGKMNDPLYFYSQEDTAESLHLQMIVQSSLDVMEERRKKASLSSAPFEMSMGQLFPIEDYKTFGCYFNTHNKTIMVCDAASSELGGVKEAMATLNGAFVQAVQNPFQPTGRPLVSPRLDEMVRLIVEKHNNSIPKRKY